MSERVTDDELHAVCAAVEAQDKKYNSTGCLLALDLRDSRTAHRETEAKLTAALAEVERLKAANEAWHARVRTGDMATRKCAALMGFDPPADCDAPFCGCNPAWTKAIEMLQECGWVDADTIRTAESALAATKAKLEAAVGALRRINNWEEDIEPFQKARGIPFDETDILEHMEDIAHAALTTQEKTDGRE